MALAKEILAEKKEAQKVSWYFLIQNLLEEGKKLEDRLANIKRMLRYLSKESRINIDLSKWRTIDE